MDVCFRVPIEILKFSMVVVGLSTLCSIFDQSGSYESRFWVLKGKFKYCIYVMAE